MRNVFSSLEQASSRAYSKVGGGARKGARESAEAIKAGLRDQAAAQGSAYRQSGRQHDQEVAHVTKTQAQITREIQRNEKIRASIRDNSFRNMQRNDEASDRRASAARRDFGRSVVGGIGRGARAVIGGVGEAARGAGVDTSIAGQVGSVVQTANAAIRATTSGFMSKGKVATGADVAATSASIRATGDATSTRYSDVASGLEAFTSRSSDLDLGKQTLTELMQISQATGANFTDLAEAAGSVSQSLEDGPDKAERLLDTMRTFGKQAAMGSVELKDMAVYMARLSSQSEKFAGDRSTTMAQFGAIAQMGVHSGRSTSSEATSSAAAFARDITGHAGQKRLGEAGIDVFTDAKKNKMRSVEDIFVDIFKKTGGSQDKLSSMVRNSSSRAAIEGFSGTYNEAGGGDAGIAAIRAKFKEFSQTMSAPDTKKIAELQKNSDAGKAADINNRMQLMAANAMAKLVPMLERMAPAAGKVADGLDTLVGYLSTDPGKVIGAAIIGLIAKSAAQQALTNLATGAVGANASLLSLAGASMLAVGAWAIAIDQLLKLLPEKEQHDKDVEGQTQDEITNAFRQGAAPTVNGEEVAVTGRDKNGKWIYDDMADIDDGQDGVGAAAQAAQRKKTREVMEAWAPNLEAEAAQKETLGKSRVGSPEWKLANPGVNTDPNRTSPSMADWSKEANAATVLPPGGLTGTPTQGQWQKQTDAAVGAKVDALTAAIKGGIKVTNLSEIGPAGRTGVVP